MKTSQTIRFSGFVLNRTRGCLEDASGAERFLRPKSYRVLELLCERRGQLLSKDELVTMAWPDVIVSDDSLAHCISDIRRSLGQQGSELLRTVPRRGYMLVVDDAQNAVLDRTAKSTWVACVAVMVGAAAMVLWLSFDPNISEATTTPVALARADELLDARNWRRRENNETARSLLEDVVRHDPDNADAWASLGLTYWLEVQHLSWGGGRREMTKASDMVERAVVLGGGARAYRLLAEMRLLSPFPEMRSPIDALSNARAAASIDPGDPDNLAVLAEVMALTGHNEEAVQLITQAERLNPAPP